MTLAPLKWLWIRHARPRVPAGYMYGAEENVPLNLTGPKTVAAFEAIAQAIPRGAHIVSSTSPRALASLHEIIKRMNAENIDIDPEARLLEQSFGDWTGKSYAEVTGAPEMIAYRADPDRVAPPGGQSLNAHMAQVGAAIDEINERYRAGKIDASAVFASAHGGSIRAALAKARGVAPSALLRQPIRRLSLTELEWDPQAVENPWREIAVNRTLDA